MRRASRWSAFLDGAVDGAVAAFALWTLIYEIALVGPWSLWTPAVGWLVAAVLLVVGGGVLALRESSVLPRPSPAEEAPAATPARRPVVLAVAICLLVVGVGLRDWIGVWPVVLVAIGVLAEGTRGLLLRLHSGPHGEQPVDEGDDQAGSRWEDWGALGLCLGLAVLASLVRRPDADDVYYVNRSVWVEEHGPTALRDTMFGPETYPLSYGGGLPLPSIEGLLGGLAHVFGVRAGTFCYLVAVPVLAFLMGWATWRLIREWAPRRRLVAFALALSCVVVGAESIVGGYGVGRIWQGKVIAFAVLSPVIWVHLSRLASGRSTRSVAMLFLAGVSFVGLTSGAALLGPIYAAAALLAAALLRQRWLAVGGLALVVGPVASGLVTLLSSQQVGEEEPGTLSTAEAFAILFGAEAALVVVGLLAFVLGARLLPTRAAVLASCGSAVALAALLPGVFELVDAVTGAGAIAWRIGTVVPVAVLVGLLGCVRVPVAPRAGWVLAACVALVLVVFGKPLWVDEGELTTRPTWKADPEAVDDVRAVTGLPTGPGPWLLPPEHMEVLATYTTRRFAVVPRDFYLSTLEEPAELQRDRRVLLRTVGGSHSLPRAHAVREALERLEVALVCARSSDGHVIELVDSLSASPLRPVGSMVCLVRRPPAP